MDKIIDCHFHIWDLAENYYPWLSDKPEKMIIGDYKAIRKDYLIEDLKRDIGGLNVVAAVHVQAEHDYTDHVRETRWLQSIADKNGLPQGIVANADLQAPDAAAVIEGHCEFKNMRGIRQALHRGLAKTPPFDPLKDAVWLKNFDLMRKHNLVFEVQAFPEQGDGVVSLMKEFPDVQFVFTHMALPLWRDDEGTKTWKANLKNYAKCDNASVKLSGYGLFGPDWKIEEVAPFALDCAEAFGPERVLCASNFPVESLASSYLRTWETHETLLSQAGFGSNEMTMAFHDNAKRVYRL